MDTPAMTSKICTKVIVVIFLISNIRGNEHSIEELSQELSIVLKNEIETQAITFPQMQALMEKASLTNAQIDGIREADTIQQNIQNLANEVFAGVKKIQQAVIQSYANDNFSYDAKECCKVTEGLQFNERFNTTIDLTTMCYRRAESSPNGATIPASNSIYEAMRFNFAVITYGYEKKLPVVKWQYYGDEQGYFVTYPTRARGDCNDYDPRVRPWYPQTSTPGDKIVVIVLDISDIMRQYKQLSVTAVKVLLGTLNPNDWFSVVLMQTYSSRPTSGCYGNELAKATPENIERISDYLDRVSHGGSSDYRQALTAVFEIIDEGEEIIKENGQDLVANAVTYTQDREKVAVFFTVGNPSHTENVILGDLKDLNAKTNNTVRIMTYGIGEVKSEILLRNMANMTERNEGAGPVKEGQYAAISNSESIRGSLSNFYRVFKLRGDQQNKIVVSTPYTDFSQLGTIISACLPVIFNGEHKGVTCIDLPLNDLGVVAQNSKQHRESYSFMIDEKGRCSIHPLLPQRSPDDFNAPPAFVDIDTLENDQLVKDFIALTKRHETGEKKFFNAQYLQGRGEMHADGVNVLQKTLTYYSRPLQFNITVAQNYTICFVKVDGETETTVSYNQVSKNFFYTNFAYYDNIQQCEHYGAKTIREYCTIKFTTEAFNPLYSRDYTSETRNDITSANNYMTSSAATSEKFRPKVRGMVALSEEIVPEWIKYQNLSYVTQRFYAERHGFIRILPGSKLGSEYRYQDQRWYQRSISAKNTLVFTPFSMSEFNSMKTVKASRAVLRGNTVIGVIGADLYIRKFESILHKNFQQCQAENQYCFLFDDAGFMIYHPKLKLGNITNGFLHITNMEPEIANDLVKGSEMVSKDCTDLKEKENIYTWRVTINRDIDNLDSENGFFISKVPDTNMYLAIKKNHGGTSNDCPCTGTRECADYDDGDAEPITCGCPCAKKLSDSQYKYCTDNFEILLKEGHPCTPGKPDYAYTQYYDGGSSELEGCAYFTCETMITQWGCIETVGCEWCNSKNKCYIEEELPDNCESGSNAGAIAGGVVVAILAVAGIAVGGFFLYRRYRKPEPSRHISDNVGSVYDGNITEVAGKVDIPDTLWEENPDVVPEKNKRDTNITYESIDSNDITSGYQSGQQHKSDLDEAASLSSGSKAYTMDGVSSHTSSNHGNTSYDGRSSNTSYVNPAFTSEPHSPLEKSPSQNVLIDREDLVNMQNAYITPGSQHYHVPKKPVPSPLTHPVHPANYVPSEGSGDSQFYQCAQGHLHPVSDGAAHSDHPCQQMSHYSPLQHYSPHAIAQSPSASSPPPVSPMGVPYYVPIVSPVSAHGTPLTAYGGPIVSHSGVTPTSHSMGYAYHPQFVYPPVAPVPTSPSSPSHPESQESQSPDKVVVSTEEAEPYKNVPLVDDVQKSTDSSHETKDVAAEERHLRMMGKLNMPTIDDEDENNEKNEIKEKNISVMPLGDI